MNKLSKKMSFALATFLAITLITGCNSSNSSSDETASDVLENLFNSSPNVDLVKNGNIQSCPTATLGQMADAFMTGASWREFTSVSGGTVVELSGDISYQGLPATAIIQFDVTGSTFQAVYLGIDSVDQNLVTLSVLLNKMCAAAS